VLEDGGGQEQNVAWTNLNGRRVIYERVDLFMFGRRLLVDRVSRDESSRLIFKQCQTLYFLIHLQIYMI